MFIPQVVNRFSMYKNGGMMVGITGEVKMPDISQITATLEGAGFGGNMDIPVIGLLEEMEMEIPFVSLNQNTFTIMDPTQPADLMLCGAVQGSDTGTGRIAYQDLTLYVRGVVKKFTPGSVKAGSQMSSTVTLGLSYCKIVLNGKTMLEIDKYNGVYVVDDYDVLEDVRNMC